MEIIEVLTKRKWIIHLTHSEIGFIMKHLVMADVAFFIINGKVNRKNLCTNIKSVTGAINYPANEHLWINSEGQLAMQS